jgi:formyltetrahydrofolate deformylase
VVFGDPAAYVPLWTSNATELLRQRLPVAGMTPHYVTPDLDEGAVIEQDVARVNHMLSPEDLVAAGRDVESRVLARTVRWHAEHRVLLNGATTIVFD